MAARIEAFDVTIPADTATDTPVSVPTAFPGGLVERIDVQVPPGPSGLLGWSLAYADQPVIPRTPGVFIIADAAAFTWPVEGYPDGGAWSVVGYNLDVYPHTIHIQFLVNEYGDGVPPIPVPIPLG